MHAATGLGIWFSFAQTVLDEAFDAVTIIIDSV